MAAFELVPSAIADGEAVLPLALVKAQVRLIDDDGDEDELLAVLRDAAIGFVEQACQVRLQSGNVTWRGRFPASGESQTMGVGPVTAITSISYIDSAGAAATATASDFRIGTHRRILPKAGKDWPSDADTGDGSVTIVFVAGYPAGQVPKEMLQAAMLMVGHLYKHREAVMTGSATVPVPLGFDALLNFHRDPVLG